MPIKVDAWSKMSSVLDFPSSRTQSSNLIWGTDVCPHITILCCPILA